MASVCAVYFSVALSPFDFLFPFFSLRNLHAIVFYLSPAFAPVSPLLGLCVSLLLSFVLSLYVCVSPTSSFTLSSYSNNNDCPLSSCVHSPTVPSFNRQPHFLYINNTLETTDFSIIAGAAQLSLIISDLYIEREKIMWIWICVYGFYLTKH